MRLPRGRAEDSLINRLTQSQQGTAQRPTRPEDQQTCICGKVCLNEKGLKIHIGRMRCGSLNSRDLREGTAPNKTVEEVNLESNHSVHSLTDISEAVRHAQTGEAETESMSDISDTDGETTEEQQATQAMTNSQFMQEVEELIADPFPHPEDKRGKTLPETAPKPRVKWPASAAKRTWNDFDEDAAGTLNAIMGGCPDKKMETLTTIIYSMGKDRFGSAEKTVTTTNQPIIPNRRQTKIAELRVEIRKLSRQYKLAANEEKVGLSQLRSGIREQLQSLRRAENNKKNRKKRSKKRVEFINNPYKFSKKLLQNKTSGTLSSSKLEVENHLRAVHSDPDRLKPLDHCERIITPEPPTAEFDASLPTLRETAGIVRKARTGSVPGPNGVPYKVYKNCPKLLSILWKIIIALWKRHKISNTDRRSEGCFIPKEEDSATIKEFRTISLLNVEGKILLSLLSKRITQFWLANNYIDTSVQKGGIPGVSGCIEHTSVLTQLIKESVKNKGDLTVIWLDLANAYGTLPHKLIELTLTKYFIPPVFREMIMDYYSRFHIRFTTENFTTDLQQLEIGIITGCTLSVILFCGTMNLIIKSTEKISRGAHMKTGIIQPPNKAFVDDMTLSTKSVVEGRWSLNELGEVINWARMRFKPSKSRSLVIVKGKVCNQYRFKINNEWIPTLTEKPIKCLGKWFRASLNDRTSIADTQLQLKTWLQDVEKCGLPGKFKAWIYQHGILPRLLWPLLVYEIPLTEVEKMERLTNGFIKKWLGIPKSFSSVGLFSQTCKLQLPLKSVLDQYQVTKARQVMLIEESNDQCVSEAGIQIEGGRKWRAGSAVEDAKQRLRHKDIVGTISHGRQGLGCSPRQQWQTADKATRRQLVQKEVSDQREELRISKAASMSSQGRWLNWESTPSKKLSWNDLKWMEPYRISFMLRSVYDLLPTPTNLKLWKLTESPNCTLCDRPANLKHVLSACPTALTGGRYKWRHDKVLSEIAHHLAQAVNAKRKISTGPRLINFVKQGNNATTQAIGLMCTANDWEFLVDLKTQLKFPPEIAVTRKRPDMILWSRSTKQVILMELTVPWEEGIDEAYERKMLSYSELVEECRSRGWKTWCLPVEVGVRGFAAQSLWRCLKTLGIVGKARKTLVKAAEEAAEYASRWIFEKRGSTWETQKEEQKQEIRQNPAKGKGGYKPLPKAKPQSIKLQSEIVNQNITFFFGYKMPLSNFHPCVFQVELPDPYGHKEMHSLEQLYMFRKAFFFDDFDSCQKILDSKNALTAKKIGSHVSKFVSEEWQKPKPDVMRECLMRKFADSRKSQFLKQHLLDSHPIIIEASPSDHYWGIGFNKEQGPYVLQNDWGIGENWLGRLLMELREFFITSHSLDPNIQESQTYHDIHRKVRRGIKFQYDRHVYGSLDVPPIQPFNQYVASLNINNHHH